MKKLNEMTRKELAEIIVNDQIKRGIVKEEKKELLIKGRINGPLKMSWMDLYNAAKCFK